MISSAVSWFDAVEIEHVIGLFLLGRLQPAQTLGLSIGQTIDAGGLIVAASRGLLARRPEIDEFSHVTPRYWPASAKDFRADFRPSSLYGGKLRPQSGERWTGPTRAQLESASILGCYNAAFQYTVS